MTCSCAFIPLGKGSETKVKKIAFYGWLMETTFATLYAQLKNITQLSN